jgi:hypothetical protein
MPSRVRASSEVLGDGGPSREQRRWPGRPKLVEANLHPLPGYGVMFGVVVSEPVSR